MLARSRFYRIPAIVVPAPLEPGGVDNVFAIDTAVGNGCLVLHFFPEAYALRGVLFRSMLSKGRGSSISGTFQLFNKTRRLAQVSVSLGFGTLATSDRCASLSRRFLMRRRAEPRIWSELILALHEDSSGDASWFLVGCRSTCGSSLGSACVRSEPLARGRYSESSCLPPLATTPPAPREWTDGAVSLPLRQCELPCG